MLGYLVGLGFIDRMWFAKLDSFAAVVECECVSTVDPQAKPQQLKQISALN